MCDTVIINIDTAHCCGCRCCTTNVESTHYLPSEVKINLEDNQVITAGEVLAKIPKDQSKTSKTLFGPLYFSVFI
jgi:hypothetical protein